MRLRIVIRGVVQGVGFRPYVYRLAKDLGLHGWVTNTAQGVFIEVEGEDAALGEFLSRLPLERPPHSSIQSLEPAWLDPVGFEGFEIRPSQSTGNKSVIVLPDIATCPDCLREILDPGNRRHRYPFTNCTHCGPRFSILESLPYDRANTTMKGFAMCAACQAEYEDPAHRRFHAQPNACPNCGPQLAWWDQSGKELASADAALRQAAEAIADGRIVGVKGLGGFHLVCLACDDRAVGQLRERKRREEKPFAVMMPSLDQVRAVCDVSPLERRLLESPEAPIVLLKRIADRPSPIVPSVAPGNPWLGVMLPYTPLHHLLLGDVGMPLVATSGNVSDEPICTEEREAVERLAGIADGFLVHNRPIARHVDDSVVRLMAGREMVLRRARGYAPLPVAVRSGISNQESQITLGVGAHLKNAVALGAGPQVFISQHVGDLETEPAYRAFQRAAEDLQSLYEARALIVVADLHPDYLSTRFASELAASTPARLASATTVDGEWTIARVLDGRESSAASTPLGARSVRQRSPDLIQVQHHVAHIVSCMAENELAPPVLGVSWDGTGWGPDGTVWGGEFILISQGGSGLEWNRVAHLRPFRLPGGDAAVKEPRRSAVGVLYELCGGRLAGLPANPALQSFTSEELNTLGRMLERGTNSPRTSSAGRLFDAVAALTGLRQQVRHEGQAAMELEFAAEGESTPDGYPMGILDAAPVGLPDRRQPTRAALPSSRNTQYGPLRVDWAPLIHGILADVRASTPRGLIAARFHNALTEAIVEVAQRVGIQQVVLSGGCFQNRRLLEHSVLRLQERGFHPHWHQRVPTHDGGIALGQVVAARWGLGL
jgi:hydrogenase maturation protein HypF